MKLKKLSDDIVKIVAGSILATHAQTLKVDVPVVLVNATVSDMKDRLVAGLDRQNFRIWEDDVEQKVEYFSLEDMPVSVGLVLDTTGSMADKLSAARDAATAFLKTSNPRDEYFLVEFSDQPKLVQDFTTDISQLQKQVFRFGVRIDAAVRCRPSWSRNDHRRQKHEEGPSRHHRW